MVQASGAHERGHRVREMNINSSHSIVLVMGWPYARHRSCELQKREVASGLIDVF